MRSIFICDRTYFKIIVIFGISVKLPNCMYSQCITIDISWFTDKLIARFSPLISATKYHYSLDMDIAIKY
jgi:hypothetical protein